ncbi:MAG: pyridoxal phosphate-dependent aminotransferase [Nitrospirales bacterium]
MKSRTLQFSGRGERLIGQEMFKVLERAKEIEKSGERVYHLELGNSCFPPPSKVIQTTIESLTKGHVGYVPSSGHPELRAALALYYAEGGRPWITEEYFVISPANLLINQALDMTCNEGDAVAVFTPAFPTYFAAAEHIGLNLKTIALEKENGYHLTKHAIDQAMAMKPKAIIINSANNPTGAVYTQESLEYLIQECERYGIWAVSDETYAELCYRWPYWSLSSLEYSRLIVVSSFSKSYSIPGYRTGYALAHPIVASKLSLSCSTLFSCLPCFTQEGCIAALHMGETYLQEVGDYYAILTEQCAGIINQSEVLTCTVPEAAFYLFIDIKNTKLSDHEFCQRLLQEEHTALTPGSSFGRDYGSYVRASVSGHKEEVLEGIARLVRFGLQGKHGSARLPVHATELSKVSHAV